MPRNQPPQIAHMNLRPKMTSSRSRLKTNQYAISSSKSREGRIRLGQTLRKLLFSRVNSPSGHISSLHHFRHRKARPRNQPPDGISADSIPKRSKHDLRFNREKISRSIVYISEKLKIIVIPGFMERYPQLAIVIPTMKAPLTIGSVYGLIVDGFNDPRTIFWPGFQPCSLRRE
jgi:hypothetical protein